MCQVDGRATHGLSRRSSICGHHGSTHACLASAVEPHGQGPGGSARAKHRLTVQGVRLRLVALTCLAPFSTPPVWRFNPRKGGSPRPSRPSVPRAGRRRSWAASQNTNQPKENHHEHQQDHLHGPSDQGPRAQGFAERDQRLRTASRSRRHGPRPRGRLRQRERLRQLRRGGSEVTSPRAGSSQSTAVWNTASGTATEPNATTTRWWATSSSSPRPARSRRSRSRPARGRSRWQRRPRGWPAPQTRGAGPLPAFSKNERQCEPIVPLRANGLDHGRAHARLGREQLIEAS